MSEEKDKSQRLLFSHPELVEDLIRHFVGGKWLKRLDFSTLEKVSERDLSPGLVRREKDLLWRLRYRGASAKKSGGKTQGWFYVFLHLEFQSEPEPFMALRMVTYKVLFYENLLRTGGLTDEGLLPPILSVVVYNGKRNWTEARSLEELIAPIPELDGAPLPDGFGLSSYHLIAGKDYPAADLAKIATPVSALFQLEQSRNLEDLRYGIHRLLKALRKTKNPYLGESFATWLTAVLVPAIAPGSNIEELKYLTEADSMLQETVIEWRDSWLEEGRQEGLQKGLKRGRQEGRQEGEATLLLRQLEDKFGRLPSDVLARVRSADSQELLKWGRRVLTENTLEKVLNP